MLGEPINIAFAVVKPKLLQMFDKEFTPQSLLCLLVMRNGAMNSHELVLISRNHFEKQLYNV